MRKLKLWMTQTPIVSVFTVLAMKVSLSVANAATTPSSGVHDTQDLGAVLCNIIAFMFWILIVVSIIMILLAAFQYVTAGDDTEKTTKARKILTYAAVGIAVALLAEGFPQIIGGIFPSADSLAMTSCAPF
ncbi:MAG: hypothetical protein P4M10_07955 [Verrucomicrobiae bacterium]|nr:hypothetical protein [Verrucomicrobiae bacterium]